MAVRAPGAGQVKACLWMRARGQARAGLKKQEHKAGQRQALVSNGEQDPWGQNPGTQEEGMPEGRANMWQKFRLVVLNLLWVMYPTENLIKSLRTRKFINKCM